jgi:hypothetical protein
MSRIMDEVQGDCTFEFYRDGALHYRTAHGFVFPVPAADAGSATFGATEKGITLMRWIRKALVVVEEGKEATANQPRPVTEIIEGWSQEHPVDYAAVADAFARLDRKDNGLL